MCPPGSRPWPQKAGLSQRPAWALRLHVQAPPWRSQLHSDQTSVRPGFCPMLLPRPPPPGPVPPARGLQPVPHLASLLGHCHPWAPSLSRQVSVTRSGWPPVPVKGNVSIRLLKHSEAPLSRKWPLGSWWPSPWGRRPRSPAAALPLPLGTAPRERGVGLCPPLLLEAVGT